MTKAVIRKGRGLCFSMGAAISPTCARGPVDVGASRPGAIPLLFAAACH